MRYSQMFVPTLREAPAEAEIVSHRLLLRAGMIRKVAAGIYTLLPLGKRVLTKVETIIREAMDAAGAQEVLMPALQPSEIWMQSGRWEQYGPEMIRLVDRSEREFCLGPTHEELITAVVATEISTYRRLPQIFYQIQTKFRDEVRPRFGLMRGREFLMKDAYSFDRDISGMEESYRKMRDAYNRAFSEMGLDFRPVKAMTGIMGGSVSEEYMVLADSGEEAVAFCSKCDYAANTEIAEFKREVPAEEELHPLREVETPGLTGAEEVSAFLKVEPKKLIKTMIYRRSQGIIAVLIRGDRQVNEHKLEAILGEEVALVPATNFQEATGLPFGFCGPIRLNMQIIADEEVTTMVNAITGANKLDRHFTGVNPERDFHCDQVADIALAHGGESCPVCEGELLVKRGIEVGHLFQLGTKYSTALGAEYQTEKGDKEPIVMGSYGIGVSRIIAAAIEQNHDEKGIIWPKAIAPFKVIVMPLQMENKEQKKVAEKMYGKIKDAGIEVVLDDREERAGIKFSDADLIGYPLQLIVGKKVTEGELEIKIRATDERLTLPIAEAVNKIIEFCTNKPKKG